MPHGEYKSYREEILEELGPEEDPFLPFAPLFYGKPCKRSKKTRNCNRGQSRKQAGRKHALQQWKQKAGHDRQMQTRDHHKMKGSRALKSIA